jgi:GntR family transcriptional regulator
MDSKAWSIFSVSPSSGAPIYRQLMDQVRGQVAGGRLAPGDLLPSVRQVADDLSINPMTVSKAYSLLERDGILERVRGQGMAVREPAKAATRRERRETILPLLRQVAAEAFQLSLSGAEVWELLEPLLREKEARDGTRD